MILPLLVYSPGAMQYLADLKRASYDAVSDIPDNNVAIAFSGGLDSSLLAKISDELGKKITLLTIGFPRSPDIEFSKTIASKLGLHHKIAELDNASFQVTLRHVREKINCSNNSHIENCIAFFYVAKLARQNALQTVLTANGCDELFCGYNAYRLVYKEGKKAIMKFMNEKITNEFQLLSEISTIAEEFGVYIKQPFLSDKFITIAKSIPIQHKIKSADDLVRKHILRDLALSIGVPEQAALKRKKAIQYGSLIHKNIKKTM